MDGFRRKRSNFPTQGLLPFFIAIAVGALYIPAIDPMHMDAPVKTFLLINACKIHNGHIGFHEIPSFFSKRKRELYPQGHLHKKTKKAKILMMTKDFGFLIL